MAVSSMSQRSFGVEIEAWLPNARGVSDPKIAHTFTKLGVKAERTSYHGKTQDPRSWAISYDNSINPASGYTFGHTFEIVSPILKGESGLKELARIMEIAKSMQTKFNESCGIHVHVDAREFLHREDGGGQNPDMNSLKRKYFLFLKHERALDLFFPPHRLSNRYCKSNLKTLCGERNAVNGHKVANTCSKLQSLEELWQLLGAVKPDGTPHSSNRYHRLNLNNLHKGGIGTFEFRQHEATLDFELLEPWIKLCIAIVESCVEIEDFDDSADESTKVQMLFKDLHLKKDVEYCLWARAKSLHSSLKTPKLPDKKLPFYSKDSRLSDFNVSPIDSCSHPHWQWIAMQNVHAADWNLSPIDANPSLVNSSLDVLQNSRQHFTVRFHFGSSVEKRALLLNQFNPDFRCVKNLFPPSLTIHLQIIYSQINFRSCLCHPASILL